LSKVHPQLPKLPHLTPLIKYYIQHLGAWPCNIDDVEYVAYATVHVTFQFCKFNTDIYVLVLYTGVGIIYAQQI